MSTTVLDRRKVANEDTEWIKLPPRPRIRLLRGPVELLADDSGDDYPSADFVPHTGDSEVL